MPQHILLTSRQVPYADNDICESQGGYVPVNIQASNHDIALCCSKFYTRFFKFAVHTAREETKQHPKIREE